MTYSMSTAAARKASKKTQHMRSAGDWITLILLVAGALLVLFPLLVLTVNAFKTSADYNATGPLSLPKHFTMEGIISFWTTTNFPLKFWNSFIISLVVAVAAVVLSVLNSFALGIGKVKGNTWIVLGIMLANMMPQEALLYPLYTMFKQVGLYNTKLAIIIIFTIIQSAYGTYLLSSVYGTFPQAILEAAAIDGAGKWRTFRSITLPLLKPTLLLGAVLLSVAYLQFFEESFVMTQGGPLDSTLSAAYYVYQKFGFGQYGIASAASWVLFIIIALVSVLQFRILKED